MQTLVKPKTVNCFIDASKEEYDLYHMNEVYIEAEGCNYLILIIFLQAKEYVFLASSTMIYDDFNS